MSLPDEHEEELDYAATLAKLADLIGREILVEVRVGELSGPFRVAARGVLLGAPHGQVELSARRADDDDVQAFLLGSGGFFTVNQTGFVLSRWRAGSDEGHHPAQPHLNIVFEDSVLHVAVLGRPGGEPSRTAEGALRAWRSADRARVAARITRARSPKDDQAS